MLIVEKSVKISHVLRRSVMKLHVPDMSCGHCVASITKAIKAVEAEAHVICDLTTRTVEVAIHANVQPGTVVSALDEAGFTAELIQADA